MELEFTGRIFEIYVSNFVKIRPVSAELFRARVRTDRQTGSHDESNSRASQFCEHPLKTGSAVTWLKAIFSFLTTVLYECLCVTN